MSFLAVTQPNGIYFVIKGELLGLTTKNGECVLEIATQDRQTVNGLPVEPGTHSFDPRSFVCDREQNRPLYAPAAHYGEMTQRELDWFEQVPGWPNYDVVPEYGATEHEQSERRASLNRAEMSAGVALSAQNAISVIAENEILSRELSARAVWSACRAERAGYMINQQVTHWRHIPSVIYPLDFFAAATRNLDPFERSSFPDGLIESLPLFYHVDDDVLMEAGGVLELPAKALLKALVLTPVVEMVPVAGNGDRHKAQHKGATLTMVFVNAEDPKDAMPFLRMLPPVFTGSPLPRSYATAVALWAFTREPFAQVVEKPLSRPLRRQLEAEGATVPSVGKVALKEERVSPWIVPGEWFEQSGKVQYRHPLNGAAEAQDPSLIIPAY